MSYYAGRIRELFLRPRNVGEVHEADAIGDTGSLCCGAALRLTIKLDPHTRRIAAAKFKAAGCGYLIAASSVLTELLQDITMEEAASLTAMLDQTIEEHLQEFPTDKKHCAALCRDALGAAVTGYRTSLSTEWMGDEALICTCFGISEKTIEQTIQSASLRTIEQVTRACNAGAGCGSCHPLIEDILDDYWRTQNFKQG